MAALSGVEVLQNEIEKSKDKLRGYNENIKKLTGRDPSGPGIRRFLSGDGTEREENDYSARLARGRGRLFGLARRGIMEDSGPPPKRRVIGGAFSRLGPAPLRRRDREDSPYEEELPNKLSVHSSVVATSREAKNRKEIMQEQTKDKEGMQRNRRMFGLLMGTLNKFKTESKTLETKEFQRKKIEEKLEENAEKERRKFKQETKLLIEEMHLEQSKISRLQQKMEMVQEHSEREVEVKKLKNFIATKTKPRIFWRPQQMSATLENKLKESKKIVDGMLQESRDRLEKEIKELMERESKREERIKMRLREDGLLEDKEENAEVGEAGNKIEEEGVREAERVVIEVKEEVDEETAMARRMGGQSEQGGLGDESDDGRDVRKKPRRTVVVEREKSSSSESGEEEMDQEPQDKDTDKTASLDKDGAARGRSAKAGTEDVHSDSNADEVRVGKGSEKTERPHGGRPREDEDFDIRRGGASDDDHSEKDVEDHQNRDGKRNEERDEYRNKKDRSRNSARKDRRVEEREDSEEKDRGSWRKSRDRSSRRDSGDKGKSRTDHHEGRRDKERRKDNRDSSKKSSHHRRRHSDSDENDVEIKQEKDESARKGKQHSSQSESQRTTGRKEDGEGSKIQRKSKNSSVEEDDVDVESG